MNKRLKKIVLSGTVLSLLSTPIGERIHNFYCNKVVNEFLLTNSTGTYPGYLIRQGSTGENVKRIQEKLNELGFNAGKADKIFGNGTRTAVEKFQDSKRLASDGIVGKDTWSALFNNSSSNTNTNTNTNSSVSTYPGYLLRQGSTGINVKKIQEKLNELGFNAGKADEIFGKGTKTAVEKFQKSKGLESDGIVGRDTWNALFGASSNSSSSNIPKSQLIMNEAKKHLGKSYVYGATGVDTFDCSGFTQYVYKHALGIDISRTTYTQVNEGIAVSQNNLQVGDLVFTSAGHVGIYVGDNKIIHAPQTGDVVKTSIIWSFFAARRII